MGNIQQQLVTLLTVIGCSFGQYGHQHGYDGYGDIGGYGGYPDIGYGGHGHGHHGGGGYGHGHHGGYGHGYVAPVVKALPVAKVAAVAKTVDYYSEPNYSYSYGVSDAYTGDQKSAHETREGAVTKGQYQVLQPDGVLRTVNYVADPVHGFQATVHNSAPAVHAVKKVAVAPVIAKAPVYGHAHGHGGYDGGYGHGHIAPVVKATPVLKAVAPAYGGHGYGGYDDYDGGIGHGYGGHHGGYDGGHQYGGYAVAPYHAQIKKVSHASGVTHYGHGAAIAAPVYADHGYHGGYDGYDGHGHGAHY